MLLEKRGHRVSVAADRTAHAMNGDEDRCFQAGIDGCVAKPAQAETLSAAIEMALTPTGQAPACPQNSVHKQAAPPSHRRRRSMESLPKMAGFMVV
jgi:DNA-binding response OmpR family regulator